MSGANEIHKMAINSHVVLGIDPVLSGGGINALNH